MKSQLMFAFIDLSDGHPTRNGRSPSITSKWMFNLIVSCWRVWKSKENVTANLWGGLDYFFRICGFSCVDSCPVLH